MTTKVLPPPPSHLAPRRSTWVTPDGWEIKTGDEFGHDTMPSRRLMFIAFVDNPKDPHIECQILPWRITDRITAREHHLGKSRALSTQGVKR